MKMQNRLIFFIFFVMLVSCNSENKIKQIIVENKNVEVIEMPETYGSEYNINEVFKKIIVIPLDSSQECQLKHPTKIVNFKDLYVVLDFQRGVYVFDKYGEFRNRIGDFGKGPAELLEFRDFDIDKDGNVNILDHNQILKFDIEGKFINTILKFDFKKEDKFYCNPYQFTIVNPLNLFVWGGTMGIKTNDKNNQFAMYSLNNGKLKDGYFPLKYKLEDKQNRFLPCGKKILINPVVGNDTIYSITNNQIVANYFVKFRKSINADLIPNKFNSNSDFMLNAAGDNEVCYNVKNPLETNGWLSYAFTKQNKRIITLFNKSSKRIYTAYAYHSVNHGITPNIMPYYFDFVTSNGFGCILPAIHFNKIFNNIDIAEYGIPIVYLGEKNVDDVDNDVVIVYELKED